MRGSGNAWREVIRLARDQDGLVAARQALACGVARSTWDDRLRRERWERPYRGVAALPGREVTSRVRSRAVALALGPDATLTGRSALHELGVSDAPSVRPHVVVPAGRRLRTPAGVRVVRSRTLADEHRRLQRGVWVATVPRAFLDVAASSGRDRIRSWLIDARQRRLVDVGEVRSLAIASVATPGRGRLLAACADVQASGADSALVSAVETRLRAAGFPLDVPPRTVNVAGRVLHPDLTVSDERIAIEVDGFGSHSARRDLDLDQRKHNAYALAGWIVLRIGWDRLSDDWDGFLSELAAAVRQAAG